MTAIRSAFGVILFSLLLTASSLAQAPGPSQLADYQRAKDFQQNMRDKVLNLSIDPVWAPDSSGFAFAIDAAGGKQFLRVDFDPLESRPLFDHAGLARLLSDSLGREVKATDLPLDRLAFRDARTIAFSVEGRNYELDLISLQLSRRERREERNRLESRSPDGKWIAFVREYNLFVRSVDTGEDIQLSTEGEKLYEYASNYGWADIIEGEGGERPPQFWVSWSPDSKRILTQICDLRVAEKMYLLDWSVDSLYRPRLLSYYRGSPGDSTVVYYQPVIFDIETGREIRPALAPAPHFNSVNLRWDEDGQKLSGRALSRGYKSIFLLEVDASTGRVDTLYRETSDTNIDFYTFQVRQLEKEEKIFLTSERSGWNQLYQLDLKSRKLSALTNGEYVINDLVHVDETNRWVYFRATGKEKGRNPYFNHLYRIGFDGSGLRLLTPENAHHEISLDPGRRFFVDNYSTVADPTVSVLRRLEDGQAVLPLGQADPSELIATGWAFPQVFETTGRDGKTPIYGALWKPTHFDPARKYPVIDASYTGPHTNVFPNSFAAALSGTNQALAEFGFIVVRVDGLGSAGRSKAFRDWSYGKLGENLADHVRAIRYLGEQYNWIDTSRVGIFGHSAGGYDAAHALLRFPEFYKVGVASSADHDHRMEKAWWPEMYMGWPVGEHYHEQSNITMAGNLRGKLLITHGGIDENVNPSATFKLAEALIRTGKEFDMLILPSQRHGYQGKHGAYFTLKRWNYFIEHLLGEKTLWPWEE